jgi:hypothetical protein
MSGTENKPAHKARQFWRRCDRNPGFAALLEDVLADPTTGRMLLVATPELFSNWQVAGPQLDQQFRSRGMPYLSHGYKMVLRGFEEVAAFQAAAMRRAQRSAARLTEDVQATAGEELRDRLVIATLKTIQKHDGLRGLVHDTAPITKGTLRAVVKDYSGIDSSEFEDLLGCFPGFLSRSKQKKALNRLTLNLDALVNTVEADYLRRWMTWVTAERFIPLLRRRRVSEAGWRDLLIRLLEADLVAPTGPLYLWCRRCPGVGFTVSSIPLDCNLPPFCPSCGRVAQAVSAFTPVGLLRDATELTDGMLGAAVGWFLRARKIRFKPALQFGGTECDFLLPGGIDGATLLECKMHHISSPSGNIRARLLDSRNQLRDHIKIARTLGVKLSRAACIVNLSTAQLKQTLKDLRPETDNEYVRVGARLLSYEHFSSWAEMHGSRGFQTLSELSSLRRASETRARRFAQHRKRLGWEHGWAGPA